ncbi:MAG: ThuA domain-containing protein [Opitutaceae bacterium]|nr:ThuA domain-containing protein [Opitutaceae bacterium]
MPLRRLLLFLAVAHRALAAGEPLQVAVVGRAEPVTALRAVLTAELSPEAGVTAGLTALRTAHVAVFHGGPGKLHDSEVAIVREFLSAGRGSVVLGATPGDWSAMPEFFQSQLGAEPGGRFAGGAPMRTISLYPHPIHTGVAEFDTAQPVHRFTNLAEDAQLIMEGTVGEETAPLAWVRRRDAGRLVHIVPAEGATLANPAFRRVLANAVRWAGARPVPGAVAAVQRTFMPESHPGSFAITFPGGPGVCLDPVRGGINFVWDGDFVDLRPRWLTKQGAPARIFGEPFYREGAWRPLRAGAPGRESDFQFRGYALTPAGPEFHWQIDGRDVFEALSASADGAVLTRRFRVAAGAAPLWLRLEPQPAAEIAVRGLERDGELASFPSTAAGEFTIEIRRKHRAPSQP